jgi:radical SAM superfamily enzyme YgiQ (UPF0313 family)
MTKISDQRLLPMSNRPLRVLLLKPYQHEPNLMTYSPPLGLMTLVSTLRQKFGEAIDVRMFDMKIRNLSPEAVIQQLEEFRPDVIGLSAMNCEAAASREISHIAKRFDPRIIMVLGGPYALHRSREILGNSNFDWLFSGPADYTFPEALHRYYRGEELGTDLDGFSYRMASGDLHVSATEHKIDDLDALPRPAWDLVDFSLYANKTCFGAMTYGRGYAILFTSRGCPYLCSYCHDMFTKRYVYQSAASVISDIAWLYETYGITEFQIVDDIFNLHKPRMMEIMETVASRWPGKFRFSFPNGLRADILDTVEIDALCKAGTYSTALAIETVTPRLQDLIEKYLKLERLHDVIARFSTHDVIVSGFFMLGFPTETEAELQATIDFALKSDLVLANFFTVTPQPETPLYVLAEKENRQALLEVTRLNESGGGSHRSGGSWYQVAHGYPLDQVIRKTIFQFYLSPKRLWKIMRLVPKRVIWSSFRIWLRLVLDRRSGDKSLPLARPM